MIEQYSIDLIDDHVIVKREGQRMLLDTGSPMSFGASPTLQLLGQDYVLQPQHPRTTIAQLAEQVGTPLDALLGQDILGGLYYVLDWRGRTLSVSPAPLPFQGQRFAVEKLGGLPVLTITLGQQRLRVFVDTGAKLSYLAAGLADRHPLSDQASDFYPGFGVFTTSLHTIPLHIGRLNLEVQFGVLPARLQATLLGDHADGILGSDLLKACRVYFALPENQIGLAIYETLFQ
jgi:hypothetical protein